MTNVTSDIIIIDTNHKIVYVLSQRNLCSDAAGRDPSIGVELWYVMFV